MIPQLPDAASVAAPGREATTMPSMQSVAESPERTEAVKPRLLNMRQVAEYLGCSFWTARDYILQGLIPVVDMPPLRARDGDRQRKTLRRVLVDRADLDAFIESRKRRDASVIG
jgi:hypothetical protein